MSESESLKRLRQMGQGAMNGAEISPEIPLANPKMLSSGISTYNGRISGGRADGMDVSTYSAAALTRLHPYRGWGLAAKASMCQSASSSQPLHNSRPAMQCTASQPVVGIAWL